MLSKPDSAVRRKGLKGAVLIMVLAVTLVLIVMLTGAMAIVSTASKRSYEQFDGSQTYYTARDSLDTVVNVILNDSNFIDKQVKADGSVRMSDKNDGDNDKTRNTPGANDLSQGRVLQEAIFGRLTVNAANEPVYDCSKSLTAWNGEDQCVVSFDTDGDGTISSSEQITITYTNDHKKKSYMKFAVDSLKAFSTDETGFLADPVDGAVEVRIQVVDLIYDDGSALGLHRDQVTGTTPSLVAGSSMDNYIMSYTVKVVCEATYNGTSTSVSTLLVKDRPFITPANAITTPGSGNLQTGSDVFGGITVGQGLSWGNDGTIYDNVFVNGDLNINAQKEFVLGENNSVVVYGDMTTQNNIVFHGIQHTETAPQRDNPFIYVDGMIKFQGGSAKVGDSGDAYKRIDVICRGLQTDIKTQIYGDTYIDGPLIMNQNGLPTTGAMFDGDLFISDVDSQSKIINNFNLWSNITSDINLHAGDHFCTGNIYFYYSEYGDIDSDGVLDPTFNLNGKEADGCSDFGQLYVAISKVIDTGNPVTINGQSIGDSANLRLFFAKLHPVGYSSGRLDDGTRITSPNTTILKYADGEMTGWDTTGVEEAEKTSWDQKVYNMKYLISLPAKGEFCDDIEADLTAGTAVIKVDDETDIADLKLNVVMPDDITQQFKDRTSDDSDPNYDKNKVYKLPTLLGSFYSYIARKSKYNMDNWSNDPDWQKIDRGDFLDSTHRDELKFSLDYRFDTSFDPPVPVTKTKTWDWFYANTMDTMKTQIAKFKPFEKYTPKNYLDQMLDLFNSYNKPKSISDINDRAEFQVAEKSNGLTDEFGNTIMVPMTTSNFDSATAKSVENISLWTPVERFEIDTEKAVEFGTIDGAPADVTATLNDTYSGLTPITQLMREEGGSIVGADNVESGDFAREPRYTYTIDPKTDGNLLILRAGRTYKGKIIVKGTDDLYIMVVGTGAVYTDNFQVYSEDFYNVVNSTDMHHCGDTGSDAATISRLGAYSPITAPDIRWYIEDDCSLSAGNNGFLTGFFYGPYAIHSANQGISHTGFAYHSNHTWWQPYTSQRIDVVGSLFFWGLDVGNDYTVLYPDPTNNTASSEPLENPQIHMFGNAGMDIVEFVA